jgi:hypothetical protein
VPRPKKSLSDDGPSRLRIVQERPADRVDVRASHGEETVDVFSKTGIGGLKLMPREGAWPECVRVRLHLSGLESLRLKNQEVTIEGPSTIGSEVHTDLRLTRRGIEAGPIESKGPFALEVRAFDREGQPANRVPITAGRFEFVIPKAMTNSRASELIIQWVDFHR